MSHVMRMGFIPVGQDFCWSFYGVGKVLDKSLLKNRVWRSWLCIKIFIRMIPMFRCRLCTLSSEDKNLGLNSVFQHLNDNFIFNLGPQARFFYYFSSTWGNLQKPQPENWSEWGSNPSLLEDILLQSYERKEIVEPMNTNNSWLNSYS